MKIDLGHRKGAAFVWVADMDVDCDGLDYKCKVRRTLMSRRACYLIENIQYLLDKNQKNPDGQPQTNFGALAAYEVPFIVIPDKFGTTYQDMLPGNNIGAAIWCVITHSPSKMRVLI